MTKRRTFSAEFKAKVALEALTGGYTLAELSSKYGVHANMITTWKKQAQEGMVVSFSRKKKEHQSDHAAEIKDLHAKIGQLTIENDFLQKAFARR